MLEIKELNKTFYSDTEEHKIFENFSINIEKNKCTSILGPNGCGKSTLLNIISGSLETDSGQINLNGKVISNLSEEKRAIYIGKVNQDSSRGVSPNLTILENMAISLKKGQKFSFKNLIKNTNKSYIIDKLKELDLGLENKLNTQVKFLSGGQRQSLSLLMATLKKPELLLLDEHTAALDPKTSKLIMEKTKSLITSEEITTIMISHNLKNAIEYSDRIIMLNMGKLVLDIRSKDIQEEELIDLYNANIKNNLN